MYILLFYVLCRFCSFGSSRVLVHMLQQIMDWVDIGVNHLIVLVLGLGCCKFSYPCPCHHMADEGQGQISHAHILSAGSHVLPLAKSAPRLYCTAPMRCRSCYAFEISILSIYRCRRKLACWFPAAQPRNNNPVH